MAAQSALARLGQRIGVLGSAASLAICAPLAAGNYDMDAHTGAERTGFYFDRTTPGAEFTGHVVAGVDALHVGEAVVQAFVPVNTPASAAPAAGLNIGQGVAPSAPVNGDMWITVAGLFYQYNGTTVGPLTAGGGGTIGGSIAAGQVAVGSGVNTVAGSAALVWTTGSGLSSNRTVTATNEMFGLNAGNATMTAGDNTLLGNAAGAAITDGLSLTIVGSSAGVNALNPFYGTFIGAGAGTGIVSQDHNTAIGYRALFTSDSANDTAIGSRALENGSDGDNIAIGVQCGLDVTTGYANIMIGNEATVDNGALSACILIGHNAISSFNNVISIGYNANSATADNQMIVGSQTNYFNDIYFGSGYFHATNASVAVSINASKGQGTDSVGGDLNIKAGTSTGNAVGGALRLFTSKAGPSTGSGQNTLVNHWSLLQDGGTDWTGIATASAPALSAANHGTIFYDSTLQQFRVSMNGGAYANLVSGGGGTIGGSIATDQVAFGSGANTIQGAASFTFTTTNGLVVNLASSGVDNLTIGSTAGNSLTSGINNVLLGSNAGTAFTTTSNNTGVGFNALAACTGSNNVAVGSSAGAALALNSRVVVIGQAALSVATTGVSDSTAVGYNALLNCVAASNTAVGSMSCDALTSSARVTAVGYNTLTQGTSGISDCTAVGDNALSACTGASNTAVGARVAQSITSSARVTAVGDRALAQGTTGVSDCTAVGYQALTACLGTQNTAVGSLAGDGVGGQNRNSALGYSALSASCGDDNTAVGTNALAACLTSNNTAVGAGAADAVTTSTRIVAVGRDSLGAGTNGADDSTAIGYNALILATGVRNTALGSSAGALTTTGTDNIFIGSGAGDSTAAASSNRMVVGSATNSITNVWFGKGETATTPANVTIHATSAASGTTAGASLILAAGRQSGVTTSGSVIIQTATPGIGSLENRFYIDSWGGANFVGVTTSAGPGVSAANEGLIFYDETLQAFRVSQNGGAYTNLVSTGTIGGSATSGQVAFGSGANTITSSATFLFSLASGFSVNRSGGSNSQSLGLNAGPNAGADSTFVGNSAGTVASAASCTGVGSAAIGSAIGADSTGVGYAALANTTGARNTAVGSLAGAGITTGNNCTAVGVEAVRAIAADGTTGVGYRAAFSSTGAGNTAVGFQSADTVTSSTNITSIGYNALGAGTTGVSNCTAVGFNALLLCTAAGNTVVGSSAADAVTTSIGVVAVGHNALGAGSTGVNQCTAIGFEALLLAVTTNDNTAVGSGAGAALVTGAQNTFVGASANLSTNNGANNTCVGYGSAVSGNSGTGYVDCTVVGATATGFGDYAVAVGVGATAYESSVAIGTGANTAVDGAIALGRGATCTANGQFVVGSSSAAITAMYLGNGITNVAAAPAVIHATGGASGDDAGASLTLAGGIGWGSGGGAVHLQVALPGSGGGSGLQNVLTDSLICALDGTVHAPRDVAASSPAAGTIVVGTTGGQQVAIGGGTVWADQNITAGGAITATGNVTGDNVSATVNVIAGVNLQGQFITTTDAANLHYTTANLTDYAGAGLGTLTNAPSAGDPTKWIAIFDNGTQRYIPTWT